MYEDQSLEKWLAVSKSGKDGEGISTWDKCLWEDLEERGQEATEVGEDEVKGIRQKHMSYVTASVSVSKGNRKLLVISNESLIIVFLKASPGGSFLNRWNLLGMRMGSPRPVGRQRKWEMMIGLARKVVRVDGERGQIWEMFFQKKIFILSYSLSI